MGRLWGCGHSLAEHISQPEHGRALQKESRGLVRAGGTQDQDQAGPRGRGQVAPSQTGSDGIQHAATEATRQLPGRAARCVSVCAPWGIRPHGEPIKQEG